MEVEDLFVDLADGIKLLKLLEIISGEKLGKPNSGRMRVHKIENLNKSLAFLHTKVSSAIEFACTEFYDQRASSWLLRRDKRVKFSSSLVIPISRRFGAGSNKKAVKCIRTSWLVRVNCDIPICRGK